MAEETLLRHAAPFVFPWDPSITFSPGDGRAGRRASPRISAPGAEGGGDGQRMTVQNLGEDSSPWLCFFAYLVGLSIAQLSARASPRPVGWAPVLRKVLAGHEWPDPPKGTPTSFLHAFERWKLKNKVCGRRLGWGNLPQSLMKPGREARREAPLSPLRSAPRQISRVGSLDKD